MMIIRNEHSPCTFSLTIINHNVVPTVIIYKICTTFQDNLDVCDKFSEYPAEASFFTHLLRVVVQTNAAVDFKVAPIKIL